GDFGGALQHLGVQGLELADFRFQLAEALGARLVAADLRVDFAHQHVELAHFGGGAVDHVTLLLERCDFRGHAVRECLQRRELPLRCELTCRSSNAPNRAAIDSLDLRSSSCRARTWSNPCVSSRTAPLSESASIRNALNPPPSSRKPATSFFRASACSSTPRSSSISPRSCLALSEFWVSWVSVRRWVFETFSVCSSRVA